MRLCLLFAIVLSQTAAHAFIVPRSCDAGGRRAASAQRHYDASCRRRQGCSTGALRHYQKVATKLVDQCVAINQIQVLGTHNSYHIEPRPSLMQALLNFTSLFQGDQYTHPPLDQQFEDEHVRQIEIDVYNDPNGGLFSVRHGLILVGEDPNSGIPALDQPGMKVLHLPDIDFETNCVTFVQCLQVVKTWSDAHPTHVPITILVETETDSIPDIFHVGFVTVLPMDAAAFDEIDSEIRSVFPPERLITPDDVRGGSPTLEQAVLTRGWPSLTESRGKVMFLHDNASLRTTYQRGHTSLEGLVLFTNSKPGQADAAFVEHNDAAGSTNIAQIGDLVTQGYMVRTRADADTVEARSGDTTSRDAALVSGAQFVSTDYPEPDPRFTNYSVTIPDGPVRCNPINAPAACRSIGIREP